MMMDMENNQLVERVEHALALRRAARNMLPGSTLVHLQHSQRSMVTHI
ncbi:hypothetical protein [Aliiruegeria sabulilitoris]|nr:hypothetical protein [Aliiruegeria sabulilitoris]